MEELLKQVLTKLDRLEIGQLELKSDISGLQTDVSGLKTDVSSLKADVKNLTTRVEHMEGRQDEIYQIVRAWEEETLPITKKTLDNLTVDMAKLKNHKHNVTIGTAIDEAAAV